MGNGDSSGVVFFRVQSFHVGGLCVLCVAIRIKGVLTMFFTSDRADYAQWIAPLRTQIPSDNMEAIDSSASKLITGDSRCGTRIVTGWAAMAVISVFGRYMDAVGSNCQSSGWELPPHKMDSQRYLTRAALDEAKARGEPMFKIDIPQDVVYIFTREAGYCVAIVYSIEQIAELALRFRPLASTFVGTIPIMQHVTLLPATSTHELIVFGEASATDHAAAILICMWIRMVRFLGV